jgi:hypothetical protein
MEPKVRQEELTVVSGNIITWTASVKHIPIMLRSAGPEVALRRTRYTP